MRGRGGGAAGGSVDQLDIVVLGLSITSSWGNGHATNYRALLEEMHRQGHRVLFLERDVPWYASHRDLPEPPCGETRLYASPGELRERWTDRVRGADLVVVGSYVPDGVEVGRWVQRTARGVRAFYDIDTPVTLAKLDRGDHEYLHPDLVPGYDLYLSFTGGPILDRLEDELGSPAARPFHCLVDPDRYRPEPGAEEAWLLGYMGTHSDDRQPAVERLLLEPARRRPDDLFVVAGPGYPADMAWPDNVERVEHLPPARHRAFYTRQRFTLNVTRPDMVRAGWSPSVRLFEAAACGVPVISDVWEGIDRFFVPGEEILLARDPEDVVRILDMVDPERARAMGDAARRRVLREHTAPVRVRQLLDWVEEVWKRVPGRRRASGRDAGNEPSTPHRTTGEKADLRAEVAE